PAGQTHEHLPRGRALRRCRRTGGSAQVHERRGRAGPPRRRSHRRPRRRCRTQPHRRHRGSHRLLLPARDLRRNESAAGTRDLCGRRGGRAQRLPLLPTLRTRPPHRRGPRLHRHRGGRDLRPPARPPPRHPDRPAGPLGATDIGVGEIFSRLLGRHLDISTGAAVPADPYRLVLGVLSLLFFGHVDIMVRSLLLAAPILAGISAYAGAGCVRSRRWVRGFVALLWIASPLFITAVSDGRLGVVLVWIAAPLLVLTLRRSLRTGS